MFILKQPAAAGRYGRAVRFIISWHFPNAYNYWTEPCCDSGRCNSAIKTWKNYYAVLFPDSKASAKYSLENWDRLYAETKLFKDALFNSSLPPEALDAVSANISILKSPTCLRLEGGEFYGWEGCFSNAGCCEGSCEWPEGKYKPVTPAPYSEESMHGFEYQAGIHMIQEGLAEEGLKVIRAVRKRYDGTVRNPWNEFECGSNYARSMASYALLNAFSGFSFDMVNNMIGFDPIEPDKDCNFFFSLNSAWGTIGRKNGNLRMKILYGQLEVSRFKLPKKYQAGCASLDSRPVAGMILDGCFVFEKPVRVSAGSLLMFSLKRPQ